MKTTKLLRVRYPIYDWVERGIEVEVDDTVDDYDLQDIVRDQILDAEMASIIGYPNEGDEVAEGVTFVTDHGITDRGYLDDYNDHSDFRDWTEVEVIE